MNRFLARAVRRVTTTLLLTTLLLSGAVQAAPEVHFHGTLMTGSCRADTVDVDFGEVTVADVTATTTTDTSAAPAAMPATLKITCTGGIAGTVQVSLTGTPSTFNGLALETNITDLGVQVSSVISGSGGGMGVMTPGTWYPVPNGKGDYALSASLVRNPGATLKGGDFLATGTIAVQIA